MNREQNQQNEQTPSAEEILRLAEQLNSFAHSTEYLDYFYNKLETYVKDAEANRQNKIGVTHVN